MIASPIDFGGRKIYAQSLLKADSAAYLWYVRIVDHDDSASMAENTRSIALPTVPKRKSVEVNRAAIKAGQELTVYRPPIAPKATHRSLLNTLGQALKTPKLS